MRDLQNSAHYHEIIESSTRRCSVEKSMNMQKDIADNTVCFFQVAVVGDGDSGQDQGEELVLSPRTQQEAANEGGEDAIVSEP